MNEVWYLWQDKARSPYMNMAVDEALMLLADDIGKPVLRLYAWDREAVSIGYTQKIDRTPQDRGTVVRRPTGGGIVFHKHHFTYTVTMPNSHWIVDGTKPVESYNWLNKSVKEGLSFLNFPSELASNEIPGSVDRAGMVCFVTPTKYDILADGRKIAGSAQRRAREGMLHQGSIEMENIEELSENFLREVLPLGFEKVLNVSFKKFEPPEKLLEAAAGISRNKYSLDKWNRKR